MVYVVSLVDRRVRTPSGYDGKIRIFSPDLEGSIRPIARTIFVVATVFIPKFLLVYSFRS